MKKGWIGVLSALLAVLVAGVALAAARLPEARGAVTDDANVLSSQTAKDIALYAQEVEEKADLGLHVAVVHFLDGLEVRAYARELFEKWELGENDLLLLTAAGEDSFATVLGAEAEKKLGAKNAENLMYLSSSFSDLISSQQYDAAFDSWFTAFNTLLGKQCGVTLRLGTLFQSAQSAVSSASEADFGSQLWQQVLGKIDENTADYQKEQENRQQEDNGIGVGGWIILIILVMIIFGQSDPVRKARNRDRAHYRDYGCGCSPLGWILAMIGAGTLLDKLRGRRS